MCCSLCGGTLITLGVLGNLLHCQCRDCGMSFSVDVDDYEND